MIISRRFPRYETYNPGVPVYCVTPGTGRVIHRFFDTSPFSPSGHFMALFRLPFEDRLPGPGDRGEIILVNLETGKERTVSTTCGWEPQMGANLQWAANDTELLFNDVDTRTWQPYAVKLNIKTGERKRLEGCVYRVSPDGRKALSANMVAMRRTQEGYGVVIPDDRVPQNVGLRDDDGLYITDTETGTCRLLISIREIVERTVSGGVLRDYTEMEVYGFHCKWNPQGTRLIFTLRRFPKDHPNRFNALDDGVVKFDVFTMRGDTSDLHNAVPASEWEKGGHHINWFPDGERLSMNLNIERRGMRFVRVNYDGTGLDRILDQVPGSGHPTVHPNGRHILTDAYPFEPVAFGDGTVPIRLVDLSNGEERTLIRIRTQTEEQSRCPALRVDPHPAWDYSNRLIAFNGFADGTRRVYLADLSGIVG